MSSQYRCLESQEHYFIIKLVKVLRDILENLFVIQGMIGIFQISSPPPPPFYHPVNTFSWFIQNTYPELRL
jgi:hypothetical protein